MNRITKAINALDKALAPLGELVKDEEFKGELLLAAGAKEKPAAADKAKTKEKLNFLLRALDAFRKKLGLDKSDIPNVSNIAGLAVVIGELYIVYEALHDLLKSCDYFGLEDAGDGDADLETAINNAVGAVAGFLAQTAITKKYPDIATLGEAVGIFSRELNETKRALDLALFPLLKLGSLLSSDLNPDALRPVGDFKGDDPLRLTKGIFLSLSILFMIMGKKVSSVGSFLFNQGHDLDPEKDHFPNAAKIAGRVLQMQFVPGEALSFTDDEPYPDHFRQPNTTDAVISFASIPVFSVGAEPGAEPEGFQYVLGLEFNPGEFGTEIGNFSIRFPTNYNGSFIWGHNTPFHVFTSVILGSEPLVEIRWKEKADGEEAKNDSDVSSGDILFKLLPKIKTINGKEDLDCEFSLELKNFSYSLGGDGRDGFLQKILPEKGSSKINASLT
ncbi:MAG TPA: hypothetical protein VFV68_04750, partial [Agriterribacter sp.]|nr:hypothetical protein [Agriterribacter sp.]